MFKETEAYNRINGKERFKIGAKVPKNDIPIAYVHSKRIVPEENVLITDMAKTVSENINQTTDEIIDLWPDDKGMLKRWDGSTSIEARSFSLTNRFMDGEPLFYIYMSKNPIHTTEGFSREDLLRGVSISSGNQSGLPEDALFEIGFVTVDKELYVHVFTNLEAKPSDNIRLYYTAVKDNKVLPGYSEAFISEEAFNRENSLINVMLGKSQYSYYQTDSEKVGETKLYVESVPLKEDVYRKPVPFRYQVKFTLLSGNGEVKSSKETPWIYDEVFCKDELSKVDTSYTNGWKTLHNEKTAKEIFKMFSNEEELEEDDLILYSVKSSNESVSIYTQQDGNTTIKASTGASTGILPEPNVYKVENRVKKHRVDVWVSVDGGEMKLVTDTISVAEGNKLIAGPFEGSSISIALQREGDPYTVFVADNSVYVKTDKLDIRYVEKYAAKIRNNNRIKTELPASSSDKENWYLQIKNGQFIRKTDEGESLYTLPEYYSQGFDKEYGAPYKRILNETPKIVGRYSIQTNYSPLYVKKESQGFNIEVEINGIPAIVSHWNRNTGEVTLEELIIEGDIVSCSYIYEEMNFAYKGYYDAKANKYLHLDINPGPGHTYTYIDEETGDFKTSSTFNLLDKTIYIYLKPNAKFDTSDALVEGSYLDTTLYHSFKESVNTDDILLAKVHVRPNSTKENIKLVDVRKRGGGIAEYVSKEEALRIEPDVESYWDLGRWDGAPIETAGVYIVKIPKHVLREFGGRFTKEEVENTVRLNSAFGTMAVVEYVNSSKRIVERPRSLHVNKEVTE